ADLKPYSTTGTSTGAQEWRGAGAALAPLEALGIVPAGSGAKLAVAADKLEGLERLVVGIDIGLKGNPAAPQHTTKFGTVVYQGGLVYGSDAVAGGLGELSAKARLGRRRPRRGRRRRTALRRSRAAVRRSAVAQPGLDHP
ncbi:hypothetical protein, partial [Arthrobacter sp.]|uniref:hypothetical protein n=1 Tax=Arthrobacter sp. TaxID=1667 RepID=UPI00289B4CE9